MSRVLIFDPCFNTSAGHHRMADERAGDLFAEYGVEADVLCSLHYDGPCRFPLIHAGLASLYCRPDLSYSWYVREANQLADILAPSLQSHEHTHFFIPMTFSVAMKALAIHLKRTGNTTAKVAVCLLFPPWFRERSSKTEPSLNAEMLNAYESLVSVIGEDNLMLYCETHALAGLYCDLFDHKILVSPLIESSFRYDQEKQREIKKGDPLTVTMLGHANREKGYDRLGELISIVEQTVSSPLHWNIQGCSKGANFDADKYLHSLTSISDNVTVSTEHLTEQEYVDMFEATDIMLLPYNSPNYHYQGSGIFSDCEAAGIPMILSPHCGFAKQAVREQRALYFTDWTHYSLGYAFRQLTGNYDVYKARSVSKARLFASGQCRSPLRCWFDYPPRLVASVVPG